eukprot:jgi/Mesvir1/6013/Mv00759-RA.1
MPRGSRAPASRCAWPRRRPDTAKLKHQVTAVKQKLAAVAETVLTSFEARFPEPAIMQAFEVFHPEYWEEPKSSTAVAEALDPLVQLYCNPQQCKPPGVEPFEVDPLVRREDLMAQYKDFKKMMQEWATQGTDKKDGRTIYAPWRQEWAKKEKPEAAELACNVEEDVEDASEDDELELH